MAEANVGPSAGADGIEADDHAAGGGLTPGADVGSAAVPVEPNRDVHAPAARAAGKRLRGLSALLREPEGYQPGPLSARTKWRQKQIAAKAGAPRRKLRPRKKRKPPAGLLPPPDLGSPFVPLRQYDAAVNKLREYEKIALAAEKRLQLIFENPHLIALARGDLYLRKEEAARFQVPLGYFLFHVIPSWVAGGTAEAPSSPPHVEAVAESRAAETIPPPPSSPTVAGPPAVDSGLRTTVVAVVTALAELGLIQLPGALTSAGKPPLPAELHPGAAPVVVGNEIAGAWSPPPRPTLEGPRSAVRRAMYEMLSRS